MEQGNPNMFLTQAGTLVAEPMTLHDADFRFFWTLWSDSVHAFNDHVKQIALRGLALASERVGDFRTAANCRVKLTLIETRNGSPIERANRWIALGTQLRMLGFEEEAGEIEAIGNRLGSSAVGFDGVDGDATAPLDMGGYSTNRLN